VSARQLLAQLLWVQGFPDQAVRTAAGSVEDALRTNHALSLMNALEVACLLALFFVGDLPAAQRYVTMLQELSGRHAVTRWNAHCRYYQAVLFVKGSGVGTGLPQLRSAVNELSESGFILRYSAFLGDLAEALGRAGDIARGLEVIDDALARCEAADERWCIAELFRAKGEILVLDGTAQALVAAEKCFRQGLEWARGQDALSWELRCASSLARLWSSSNRGKDAAELLAPVYSRFTEGFETADLKGAKGLLDSLRQPLS
jgi:predicted ATPase